MESIPSCLINVDDINYKIDLKQKNGERKIDLNCLHKLLTEVHEELSDLDLLNKNKFIIEVFDHRFQDYVPVDDEIEIVDKAKLRARSLEIDLSTSSIDGSDSIEDEVLIVKDLDDKTHLVNIVCKLHMDYIGTPIRGRRRKSNHILEENLRMKEKFWSSVSEELAIARNRNFKPEQCMAMFFGLLSQYQYVLRKFKRLTEDKVQEMWPFFKAFHHKIDCKLFSKVFNSLKSSFDTCKKDYRGNKDSKHHSKSECSRLEEDFNLIISVINRLGSFRKPPRVAAWKVISDDMADYNSPNSRMTAFRWQKRFHELLTKYVQISSQNSQMEKETWPLFNLFSQIDIDLFMKASDKKTKERRSTRSTRSPIPIDLSDSESEFVVIDEITAESDQEETQMVDLEEDEIDECVREVLDYIIDQVDMEV